MILYTVVQELPDVNVDSLRSILTQFVSACSKAVTVIINLINAMPWWVSAGIGVAFSGAFLFWLLKEVVL